MGELFNELRDALGQEIDLVTLESLNANDSRKGRRRFAQNLDRERVLIYEKR
jgi:predicted nucleotidyltransferase